MRAATSQGFDWVAGGAQFQCARCPNKLTIKKPGIQGRISPATMCILAREKGWEVHAVKKRNCLCPDCQRRPKEKNDTDSELRKFKPFVVDNQEIVIVETTKPHVVASNTTPKIPEPTTRQRLDILTKLDKHFDDEIGRYLDGYSDRKIAEEIGLPAIVVKNIREMAYGPEKLDPEISAILSEIEYVKNTLASMERRLQAVIDKAK